MKKSRVNRSTLIWLFHVTGKAWYALGCLCVSNGLLSLASVAQAWIIRGLVDGATSRQPELFWHYVRLYAAVTIGRLLLSSLHSYLYARAEFTLDNRLRQRLFCALLRKDYATVTATQSGHWLTRLVSETSIVSGTMLSLLPSLLGLAVQFCAALWLVMQMLPGVVYVVLPAGVLMILGSWLLSRILKRLHKQLQEANGRLTTFFSEYLGGMMVIRAFGKEASADRLAQAQLEDFRRAYLRKSHFSNFSSLCFSGGMYTVYLLCTIYGGYCILNGAMSYGTFTAMLQLVGQVQAPMASISGFLPRFNAMLASAERLIEVENYPDDCSTAALSDAEIQTLYSENFSGLGTEELCFAYPAQAGETPAVLSGLNLRIRKGEYAALTGHSGCGKSTLLKLLLDLYHPSAGRCFLDVGDKRQTLTSQFRGLFAYVPQGNQLISGSIRDAVTFGSRTPDEARLRQALDIACAGEFVQSLDKGLDTQLGERGAGLSEGQMQRIAIARALYSGRPILLLDEATSALDEATERQLLVNLRELTDKTVLIITHRPAALEICDTIISFEGGTP